MNTIKMNTENGIKEEVPTSRRERERECPEKTQFLVVTF